MYTCTKSWFRVICSRRSGTPDWPTRSNDMCPNAKLFEVSFKQKLGNHHQSIDLARGKFFPLIKHRKLFPTHFRLFVINQVMAWCGNRNRRETHSWHWPDIRQINVNCINSRAYSNNFHLLNVFGSLIYSSSILHLTIHICFFISSVLNKYWLFVNKFKTEHIFILFYPKFLLHFTSLTP